MTDDEHELHYNPRRAVPNFAQIRQHREADNQRARATLRRIDSVPYGTHPLCTVDIFPASDMPAPVHIFFHGGYWRSQDKENFSFVAEPLVLAGITTVIVNYPLCPEVTLDGVADAAVACFRWVRSRIGDHGGDPARISLSGHSAGAHLVAEILAAGPASVQGAVMVSGIYDPAPAMRTTVNAELNLTPEIIGRHDVATRPPTVHCPTWLFVGGAEPWRWIDQTFQYSHHLRRHGGDPEVRVLPGFNHFDIMSEYATSAPIGKALLAASLGSPPASH